MKPGQDRLTIKLAVLDILPKDVVVAYDWRVDSAKDRRKTNDNRSAVDRLIPAGLKRSAVPSLI